MTARESARELSSQLQAMLTQIGEARIMGDGERESAVSQLAQKLDADVHTLLAESRELTKGEDREELLRSALKMSGRLRRMIETAI